MTPAVGTFRMADISYQLVIRQLIQFLKILSSLLPKAKYYILKTFFGMEIKESQIYQIA